MVYVVGDVSATQGIVNYQQPTRVPPIPIFRTPGLMLELKIQKSPVDMLVCWLSMESMAIIIIYSTSILMLYLSSLKVLVNMYPQLLPSPSSKKYQVF